MEPSQSCGDDLVVLGQHGKMGTRWLHGDNTVEWDGSMDGREAWITALNGSVDGMAHGWYDPWTGGQHGQKRSMDSSAKMTAPRGWKHMDVMVA